MTPEGEEATVAAIKTLTENVQTLSESLLASVEVAKATQNTLTLLNDSIEGLRTVSILVASGLAKMPRKKREEFIEEIAAEIQGQHPPENHIPLTVLDFRAAFLAAHHDQPD